MNDILTINTLVFILIGILSMFTHAIKKWLAGEIKGGLIDWYVTHPKATVSAFLACIGGIMAAVVSCTLTDYTVGVQVLAAWGIGYGSDTLNNQGKL